MDWLISALVRSNTDDERNPWDLDRLGVCFAMAVVADVRRTE
jgi:hypothetical protein